MATSNSLDMSNKDFTETYENLLDIMKNNTKWDPSTSSEANPGVILLKLLALVKDKLDYKIDLAEAQAYLSSVSHRPSAFELLQMLGYTMKEARSATGYLRLSKRSKETVVLPAFTEFTDEAGETTFFSTEKVTLSDSENTELVFVVEGTLIDIQKEGKDTFNLMDIDESGRLFLEKTGLAQNGVFLGLEVAEDNDIEYDYSVWKNIEVNALSPRDLTHYFYVLTSETGENFIQFPDNFESLVGNNNFVIKACFTKGAAGNISKGTITKTALANESVVVRQPENIINGKDEESIDQAVRNYYATSDVAETLLSSSDFSAAIRFLSFDGDRLFSNSFCSTAITRQLKVRTKYRDTEYTSLQFDYSTPDKNIEATCLSWSGNYEKSFRYAKPGNNTETEILESEINELLNKSKSIASNVVLSNTSRFLAVTALIGTVITNVSSQYNSGIQTKIINNLKSIYNAANINFGSDLDYKQLIDNIKKSDDRIANVILNIPEYQINEKISQVDGEDSFGFAEEKEKIIAKAVVEGKVPLFKYMNRPNGPSDSILDSTYMNYGIGTLGYTSLESAAAINPTVSSVNTSMTLGSGKLTLNKNQVIQFYKELKRTAVEYGFGMKYDFLIKDKKIENQLTLTSATSLGAGSILAEGSKLLLIGPISEDLNGAGNYDSVENSITLTMEYVVISTINLKKDSLIKPGSYFPGQTIINGSVWQPKKTLGVNEEYQLDINETIEIYSTEGQPGSVILTAGDWIRPSFAMQNTGTEKIPGISKTLGTNDVLSVLEEDRGEVSKDFVYFLRLNSEPTNGLEINTDGYMLQENEYFVYADKAVSEYVILGAGTILRTKESSATFKNIISLDPNTDVTSSVFEDMPATLEAVSTEIMTFTNGTEVKAAGMLNYSVPMGWEDMPGGSIEIKSVAGDYTFKQPYKIRGILDLSSDAEGTCEIFYPVSIKLEGPDNKTLEITPEQESSKYLITSTIFSSAITKVGQSFLPGVQKAFFAVCEKSPISLDSDVQSKTNIEITPKSLRIFATDDILEDSGGNDKNISMNIYLPPGCKYLLLNADVRLSDESEKVSISIGSGETEGNQPVKLKFMGNEEVADFSFSDETQVPTSKNVTLLYDRVLLESSSSEETLFLNISFSALKAGSFVELNHVSYIKEFSEEIQYTKKSSGEKIDTEAYDYYKAEVGEESGDTLLSEIRGLVSGDAYLFNWLCTPGFGPAQPTKSGNFFVKAHPLNAQVIPFIDFEKTKKTLVVMPGVGGRK